MRVQRLMGVAAIWVLALTMLTSCGRAPQTPVVPEPPPHTRTPRLSSPTATLTASPMASPSPSPTHTPTPTATPTRTPKPTIPPTATPTPTPDPFAGLTIADLAARTYGGGALQVVQTLEVTEAFTRTLIAYPSDGLTIYGFMDTPKGEGPFPVVVVVHGYVRPERYRTLTYTTRYADALARARFLTIHPNLRGYGDSDEGPNRFRVGFAVDVLNLLALVRTQGGQPGPLQQADPSAVGLWGHSMGGGIALRVITVDPQVQAAVLYGSMSGDERANYERVLPWSGGERGHEELQVPDADLRRISPIYHLERIAAAVSIHHGEADETVPPEWSEDLCARLEQLGKEVECFAYPGEPHILTGEADARFIQRTVAFFRRHLVPGPAPAAGP